MSIDGKSLASLSDNELAQLRRRKIGFIFQFFNLIPILDAVDNAALLRCCSTASTANRPSRRPPSG